MVYGCDGPWWQASRGLPDFKGTKLAHDTGVCATFSDVHKIEIAENDNRFLFDEPGLIGSGGNSGFQAINIAAQFGATRILLIGFDMHAARGLHWYGPNRWRGSRNPADSNMLKWRNALTAEAPRLKAMGIEVINASPDSALACFPRMDVETALREWD